MPSLLPLGASASLGVLMLWAVCGALMRRCCSRGVAPLPRLSLLPSSLACGRGRGGTCARAAALASVLCTAVRSLLFLFPFACLLSSPPSPALRSPLLCRAVRRRGICRCASPLSWSAEPIPLRPRSSLPPCRPCLLHISLDRLFVLPRRLVRRAAFACAASQTSALL